MKRIIIPVVLTLLFLLAGGICWTLGEAETRLAHVESRNLMMEHDAVAAGTEPVDSSLAYATRVPLVGDELEHQLQNNRASADYWRGRYDALGLQRDSGGTLVKADPQLVLLAANAAYRASWFDAGDRAGSIRRLQTVVETYLDLLKSHPELLDVAYNYEFTSRLRNALARGGRPPLLEEKNLSIHGHGGRTPAAEANKFNVVVPKAGEERTLAPAAGQGKEKIRKG